ncbi:MAG: hypothetical protein F6K35_46115, partial [Okeania sp. SIO2H7]|nr:hypothetical protein [Okeania sp. SIO2H7]
MTKKQESPYQMSLDIPAPFHQSTDLVPLASDHGTHELAPGHLNDGDAGDSESDGLLESEHAASLYATQISLLDAFSVPEAESASG